MPLEEAVVHAGAVRFRPVLLLTAAAVVVGAGVIFFDPIFQGLAISPMAGEGASTLLSRMAVPVLYCVSERGWQMTTERYIRIIAGTFVLASLALGTWVNHNRYCFTAFVGANLFQSGFSNWCLMEDILRKVGVGKPQLAPSNCLPNQFRFCSLTFGGG
jgi:hypothetical protein